MNTRAAVTEVVEEADSNLIGAAILGLKVEMLVSNTSQNLKMTIELKTSINSKDKWAQMLCHRALKNF